MSLPLCPKHKVPLLPEGSQVLYCPDPSCCHATTRAALGEAGKQRTGGDVSKGGFKQRKAKDEEEIP